ncbi:MAG: hypothetical protein AUH92_04490 [Acidobacteria bacterium 13_1_40CM_4_69_4]|nr:MAG: hypothetical protein AUH92_04490 [Acidobacteria bacterium 13_1_40CM_4_69_4]
MADLTTYLSIMNEIYTRAAPASDFSRVKGRRLPWPPPGDPGAIERTARNSPYLRRMLPGLRDGVEEIR